VSRIARRLAAVEAKLMPRQRELLGVIETHRLDAWPACKDSTAATYEQCSEHGPTCGVNRSRVRAPIRHVVLLRGGPWLGLG
jgi:hypothetical protein